MVLLHFMVHFRLLSLFFWKGVDWKNFTQENSCFTIHLLYNIQLLVLKYKVICSTQIKVSVWRRKKKIKKKNYDSTQFELEFHIFKLNSHHQIKFFNLKVRKFHLIWYYNYQCLSKVFRKKIIRQELVHYLLKLWKLFRNILREICTYVYKGRKIYWNWERSEIINIWNAGNMSNVK